MGSTEGGGIGLVASYVLAGGTLTGKYHRGESGRASEDGASPAGAGHDVATSVVELAREWDVPPAHVAFGYAF